MIALCPHCHKPLRKPKRKRVKHAFPGTSIAAKRKAKRETHRAETARIREAVFNRAEGRCEAYLPRLSPSENLRGDRCTAPAVFLDHWEGGVGRRRQRQSIDTCWALCQEHNSDRTANHPGAWWWNWSRELHCAYWGILFVSHVERASPPRDGRPNHKEST